MLDTFKGQQGGLRGSHRGINTEGSKATIRTVIGGREQMRSAL